MKSVCVFCGSNVGFRPEYARGAREMGAAIASRGLALVYGGGNVGLMGVLADSALENGAHVTGVIPQSMAVKELAHDRISELRIVGSMHERKATMAELADAFVAMPGGLGTFEEFFEVLTWAQLGYHGKPVALLNLEGYFDGLLAVIDRAADEGFVRRAHRSIVISDVHPDALLDRLAEYHPRYVHKWIDREEI